MSQMVLALRMWSSRRWIVAALGSVLVAVVVALPTAVIPNPVFGRAIEVTWWSYPVVVITGILGGMLLATYVKEPHEESSSDIPVDKASKLGMAGGIVSFFAVGCPVCNKLVLIALGTSGAISWFAPIQPFLALGSIVLMVIALGIRLKNQTSCAVSLTEPSHSSN